MSRNLTLVFKIALVSNEDDGEEVLVLDAENLLVKGRDFLKRVAGCDRVDEQEPLAGAHVLFTHSTKIKRRSRSIFFPPLDPCRKDQQHNDNNNDSNNNKGGTNGESPFLREESMKKKSKEWR